MIYVHELKIKLLKSKFESCPVSSCSRSSYLGIVTSFFPASQASCELVFPLLFLRRSRSNSLNAYFPDLCLEGQNLSSHNLRSGSIFVSLCNNIPADKAKRKQSLIQTFYETSAARFFERLTFAESANQNYFRCLFF